MKSLGEGSIAVNTPSKNLRHLGASVPVHSFCLMSPGPQTAQKEKEESPGSLIESSLI